KGARPTSSPPQESPRFEPCRPALPPRSEPRVTSAPVPQVALGQLPTSIRADLLAALNEIVQNFRAGRWEPSELNAGKLCEIVYTIIRGHAVQNIPAKASKPKNMVDACRDLEKQTSLPRSLRI